MIKKIIITILIGAIIFGIGYGIKFFMSKNSKVQEEPVVQEATVEQNEVAKEEVPIEEKEQIYLLDKTMIDQKFEYEDLVVKIVDKERELEVVFEIYLKHDNELKKIYSFEGFMYRGSKDRINRQLKDGYFIYDVNIFNSPSQPAACVFNKTSGWIKLISCGFDTFLDSEHNYLIGSCIHVKHPTFKIMDLQTDKIIKTVVYDVIDNSLYPVEWSFKDNAFYVTLSADTTDFVDLKIPVDPDEDYIVLDSLIENTFILSSN